MLLNELYFVVRAVQKFRLSEFVGDSVGWIKLKHKKSQYHGHFLLLLLMFRSRMDSLLYMQNSIRCRTPCETHLRQPETDARGRCVTTETPLWSLSLSIRSKFKHIIAIAPRTNSKNIVLGEYFSFPKIIGYGLF